MSVRARQDQIIAAAATPEEEGVEYFLSILRTETDAICRWHAIKALGRLKARDAVFPLVEVLTRPDTEFDESSLHRICAWSLGQIGHSATSAVLKILEDNDSDATTIAAIDAIGELRDASAISVVAPFLKSTNSRVVLWAALALGKIGEPSLAALAESLEQADARLVYIIVDTLAMIGTEATVSVLTKAVSTDMTAVLKYFSGSQSSRAATYAQTIAGSQSLEATAIAKQVFTRQRGGASGHTE